MNKCLVTKLKASTGNTALPVAGGFFIEVKSADSGDIIITSNDNSNITVELVEGDGAFYTTSGEYIGRKTTSPFRYKSPTSTNAKVLVRGKYTTSMIFSDTSLIASLNIDDLKYSDIIKLNRTGNVSLKGNLSSCEKMVNLEIMVGDMVNVSGDISVFANKTKLLKLGFSGYESVKNIYGNINSFSNCILASEINLAHIPNITGRYETLLENMFKNGRTSGSMTNYLGPNCSFNNNALSGSDKYIATFSSSGISVTKKDVGVATYNGSTWSYT